MFVVRGKQRMNNQSKDKVDYCEVVLRYNPVHLDSKTLHLLEWELEECVSKFPLPIRLKLERFIFITKGREGRE